MIESSNISTPGIVEPKGWVTPTLAEKQMARWFLETAGFPDDQLRQELEILGLTDADLAGPDV